MVCHSLPPPLPAFPLYEDVVSRIADALQPIYSFIVQKLVVSDNGDNVGLYIQSRGFTPVCAKVLLLAHSSQDTLIDEVLIVRSVEEGWVVIDLNMTRWKPLGWFDYDLVRDMWAPAILEELAKLTAAVLEIFERGEDWIWGSDGWRYEIPLVVSQENLERLAYMT